MIVANGEIGVKMIIKLWQHVLNGRGIPDECKTSVSLLIFKRKNDVMSCESYRGVKLLEHAMKIVKRLPERQIRTLIGLDLCQEKESGCNIHCKENTGGISKKEQEIVYVLC